MNILEKILEEIDNRKSYHEEKAYKQDDYEIQKMYCSEELDWITNIIRSHMNDIENDGWIQVEERLPEDGELVKVTVHSSEWIGDFDSNWVPEEDRIYHPEEYHVYDGYLSENGIWNFYDEQHSENTCEKEFGTDKGRVYDVVTAWMPIELPNPYKGE
jgi:hypothetical protein